MTPRWDLRHRRSSRPRTCRRKSSNGHAINHSDEEILAGIREVQDTGGLELRDFIHELEAIVDTNAETADDEPVRYRVSYSERVRNELKKLLDPAARPRHGTAGSGGGQGDGPTPARLPAVRRAASRSVGQPG